MRECQEGPQWRRNGKGDRRARAPVEGQYSCAKDRQEGAQHRCSRQGKQRAGQACRVAVELSLSQSDTTVRRTARTAAVPLEHACA